MSQTTYHIKSVKDILWISYQLFQFEDDIYDRDKEGMGPPDIGSYHKLDELIGLMERYPDVFKESLEIYRGTKSHLKELLEEPFRDLFQTRQKIIDKGRRNPLEEPPIPEENLPF